MGLAGGLGRWTCFVWSRTTEEMEAAGPGIPIPLVRVSQKEYHPLFRLTTVFLSEDNIDRPRPRSTLYPCCCLGCVPSLLARLCTRMCYASLFSWDVKYAVRSSLLLAHLTPLLLAAGSVSTLRLRYCPNQPY